MYSNKLTSWTLLAFVVLFWNLGPSLHHVDFFGLHASSPEKTATCCCCCTSFSPVNSDTEATVFVEQHGHCSLCDFFDQLHLVIDLEAQSTKVDFIAFAELPSVEHASGDRISAQARGPPRT